MAFIIEFTRFSYFVLLGNLCLVIIKLFSKCSQSFQHAAIVLAELSQCSTSVLRALKVVSKYSQCSQCAFRYLNLVSDVYMYT